MRRLRKLISVLLVGAMVMAVLPLSAMAEKATTNLAIATDKETLLVGETLTVTLSNNAMSVCSFTGGLHYDTAKMTLESIVGAKGDEKIYLTRGGEEEAAGVQSTLTDAARNGNVGFAFIGTEEAACEAGTLMTLTFTAKVKGTAAFVAYESSDGTDGFSPNVSADAVTANVTVKVPPRPVQYENVALYGETTDCGAEPYGGTAISANLIDADVTAGGWQPAAYKAGDWAAVIFDQTYTIDKLMMYWETKDYVSSYEEHGFEIYFLIDDTWQVATDVTALREDIAQGEAKVKDTLTFAAIDVDGVKVELLDGVVSEHKYAPKLFELEAYGIQAGATAVSKGDVDKSGEVTAADLTALARHAGAIETITDADALKAADIDETGEITASDLTALARFVGGIDSEL